MSDLSNQAQKLLGGFRQTVDVMKSAYSKSDKMMSVWAEDLYAVEAVMSFLETIRDAPAHSGQKIADIEILQQKLEFAEWEWNRATEGMKERDAKIALLESRVERADDLINDLLCLELGASERAFEYLVERGIIVTVPSTDRTHGSLIAADIDEQLESVRKFKGK